MDAAATTARLTYAMSATTIVSPSSRVTILMLQDNLIVNILFDSLDAPSLLAAAATCQRFYKIVIAVLYNKGASQLTTFCAHPLLAKFGIPLPNITPTFRKASFTIGPLQLAWNRFLQLKNSTVDKLASKLTKADLESLKLAMAPPLLCKSLFDDALIEQRITASKSIVNEDERETALGQVIETLFRLGNMGRIQLLAMELQPGQAKLEALAKTVSILSKRGTFSDIRAALEIALSIPDEEGKPLVFSTSPHFKTICSILGERCANSKRREVEYMSNFVQTISHESDKSFAFEQIALGISKNSDIDLIMFAHEMARDISDPQARSRALKTLALALCKLGQKDLARHVEGEMVYNKDATINMIKIS